MRGYRLLSEDEFKKAYQKLEREQILDSFWQYYRNHQVIIGEQSRSEEARRQIKGQLEILNRYRSLKEDADTSSENKILSLLQEISQLNLMNDKLKEELDRIHANARKAGRKRTIPEIKRLMIIHDRSCGLTLRKLKAKYGHSLSTLAFICENKLPNDNNNSLQ